jgi:hypothetical protein
MHDPIQCQTCGGISKDQGAKRFSIKIAARIESDSAERLGQLTKNRAILY